MRQDICSLSIGEQRIFNYFSVALGLMADLDLGTEHLRWMGDARFIVGFLRGGLSIYTNSTFYGSSFCSLEDEGLPDYP